MSRLAQGGLIDRERPLSFAFDGRRYQGFAGDTLASALLANGVGLVARSFKYHRPRGIVSAGAEEPNALVTLHGGARTDPNARATMVEVHDGLVAASQNRWPGLAFDLGQVNDWLSPFLSPGFYYKTFMAPGRGWRFYEGIIRRAAGMGRASRLPDPDRYEARNLHCDVLVVGGGPAGLTAALAAGREGRRVLLLDENPRFGGWLWKEEREIDGQPALDWLAAAEAELAAMAEVRLLPRTTAFGYYDHNLVAAVERVTEHLESPGDGLPRQRLWRIRAGRVVLATGATEQILTFADNDRPGVMLAGAVRAYLHAYGVLPGRRAVIATNNDSAYRTALALHRAGAEVAAVLDSRSDSAAPEVATVRDLGLPIHFGATIRRALGGKTLQGVDSDAGRFDCDLLCLSGGWAPAVDLYVQSGGRLRHDEGLGCLVPDRAKQACVSVGSAAGSFALADCLAAGNDSAGGYVVPPEGIGVEPRAPTPGPGKRFLDPQTDTTLADVGQAMDEGYRSVEHLKRYTTLGMGVDQGRIGQIPARLAVAEARGQPLAAMAATAHRPPAVPIALGSLAGREIGAHYRPLRRTPMDGWHAARGVSWQDAGLWRRPQFYPVGDENIDQASAREVAATRGGVGLCDVSPLGKIDIQGPDTAEFLNRVYVNGWKGLAVGRARYGLMLRDDGLVFDDGTTSRLAEHHYLMTTTTANAHAVLAMLEYHLQVIWPDLRVLVADVTDQWAAMSIAGPRARELLAGLVDIDIGNQAFPFMAVAECRIAGVAGRLFRISFSGELAYEVAVPADYGQAVWQAIVDAGGPHDLVTYGTESLGTMRIEKGHAAGPELNGTTTPADLSMARLVSGKKPFIGHRLLGREGLGDGARPALVGLLPVDGKTWIKAGAQLLTEAEAKPPVHTLGHVTSIAFSPELDTPIALALLSDGAERRDQIVYAHFPLHNEVVAARVTSAHFIDPDGERMRG